MCFERQGETSMAFLQWEGILSIFLSTFIFLNYLKPILTRHMNLDLDVKSLFFDLLSLDY